MSEADNWPRDRWLDRGAVDVQACFLLNDRGRSLHRFELLPHFALVLPVERFGDGAKVGLFDCVTSLGGSGQEEDLFLDVGGEVIEPHDLRHSRC